VFLTVYIWFRSPNAAPRPSTVKQELMTTPPKRGAHAAGTGDGQPPVAIENHPQNQRVTKKSLGAM